MAEPTDTKSFYIPSNEAALSTTNSDASLSATQSVDSDVAMVNVGIPNSATSPQLDSLEVKDLPNAVSFRSRAHSAPSILFQQVALQLRNISDDFNAEYTQVQPSDVAVAMQNRRLSMPALEHQWQESQDHRHPHNKISPGHQHDIHQRPYSPGALHTILQTFRALHDESSRDFKAGPSGRHRHESISEENTEDSAWEPD